MGIGKILYIINKFYALFLGIESRQSCIWLEKVITAVVISLVIFESSWPAVTVLKGAHQDLFLMSEILHGGFPKEIKALLLGSRAHFVLAQFAEEESL